MADQEANRATPLSRIFAETGSSPVFHIDEKWFHIRRQPPSQSPDLNKLDLGFWASLQLLLPSDLTIDDDDAGPSPQ